jgi:hypothetical protein
MSQFLLDIHYTLYANAVQENCHMHPPETFNDPPFRHRATSIIAPFFVPMRRADACLFPITLNESEKGAVLNVRVCRPSCQFYPSCVVHE